MNYDIVYNTLHKLCEQQLKEKGNIEGFSATEVANHLGMKRTNIVREFTKLLNDGVIEKTSGRPVLYYVSNINNNLDINNKDISIFNNIIGYNSSLKQPIALAKAAIVYPPKGLNTLIVGETGVGKSFFAKCMFKYAVEIEKIEENSPFVVFNCADYANNSQLLVAHLFGVKKGAYTGAEEDRTGIIEKSRDGILFLDEVHRLPPEGQEMLFTLMDEGRYTPLGSTEEIKINVMIISATTENIQSALLKTFTRRIPVTISLPSLVDRTIEERLDLIESFIKDESKRIMKDIKVEENALTALLNYECLNNIGELKSDIQIACAKAFLRSMFGEEKVQVRLEDFSEKVRHGLLVSKKVKPKDFEFREKNILELDKEEALDKYSLSTNIYEFIEKRREYLILQGLDEDTIKKKISDEVEKFINNYLINMKSDEKEDDIKLIVNNELYDFLNSFIYLAEYKLKRKISKNTFLGLLVHIDTFLGRIKDNKIIENPKIDEIRKKYSTEFKLAMDLADKLEQKYDINIPIDEIGYMAMFFSVDEEKKLGRVSIIVIMHGNSTATSMADVANQLLNTNHAIGFDMPLSMKPEVAIKKIEEVVKNRDEGEGALLLVDMGSLKFFGDLISESTGIKVKVSDMVTTATVIEATRKAIVHQNLDEISASIDLESRYLGNFLNGNMKNKKDVIITACSTGEGTAQKLKEIIYSKYSKDKYEVINLSLKDKTEFKKAVENIKKENNIISLISAFDLDIEGVEYISLEKFFQDALGDKFKEYINNDELIRRLEIVYDQYLDLPDYKQIISELLEIISTLKYCFDIHLDNEKLNGLLMHIGCLIQNLIVREEREKCKNLDLILSRHMDMFNYLKESFKGIEEKENIVFSQDDIGNIIEILINI